MESSSWRITNETELVACYDATFNAVYGYAVRLAGDRGRAEDLVSEVYTDLIRAAKNGSVDEIGVAWLITAVRRRFIDRLRSVDREARRLRRVHPRPNESVPPPTLGSSRTREVLASLSDRERAALVLRYLDDLSVADVARSLSISVRATESLLARARARARRAEVRDA